MKGGWTIDLRTECPVTCRKYDLRDPVVVARVKAMISRDKPRLLILCPPSTQFLQNCRDSDPGKWKSAVQLFNVAVDLCIYQSLHGGRFVLKQPQHSQAWKFPVVAKLQAVQGVHQVVFNMCCFSRPVEGHTFNPTTVMTNSLPIAEKLDYRCKGGHQHTPLTQNSPDCPAAMIDAILDGLELERAREEEEEKRISLASLSLHSDMCDPDEEHYVKCPAHSVSSGRNPVSQLIKDARQQEIRTFLDIPVYEYRQRSEMEQDALLLDTVWVDVDKGVSDKPDWRSRLCAREFNDTELRDDLFSPTPSLMVVKRLLSECASSQHKRLMILDVKRAFLNAFTKRNLYIKLPPEDPRYGEPNVVAKLIRAMYGTRDAPQLWIEEVRRMMIGIGFKESVSQPCVFFHPSRDIQLLAHVDDFLVSGLRRDLDYVHNCLLQAFEVKCKILGPGTDEVKHATFLNRHISWARGGITYEADPRHVKNLLEEWQLHECRNVTSPGAAERTKDGQQQLEEMAKRPLGTAAAKRYRRAAAVGNYLAQDRVDIGYATKELARSMANPSEADEMQMKRMLRYLKSFPRAVYLFAWQCPVTEVVCQVDSDWGGCLSTRRSTSGGVVMRGAHVLSHWSRTQATIALSSGEAELNASLKGGCELLGLGELEREWGKTVSLRLEGDSSACRGTLQRQGSGRQKHLEVRQLWMQGHIKNQKLLFSKIPRDRNASDVLTKHWAADAAAHFSRLSFTISPSRCNAQPRGGAHYPEW